MNGEVVTGGLDYGPAGPPKRDRLRLIGVALNTDPRFRVEGVAGFGHATDSRVGIERRSRHMTTDAAHVGGLVGLMETVLSFADVAADTESAALALHVYLLAMHLVTGHTGNACLAVVAGSPFGNRASVTGAAEFIRSGDLHTLARMVGAIRSVTRFAGHAGSDKLAGLRVVTGRVTGETFPLLFDALQVGLKNWIERCLRVRRAGPGVELGRMAFGAMLRTLIAASLVVTQ